MAYGIKKLQISCVIEDDKVGTDFLEENITAFEELVSKNIYTQYESFPNINAVCVIVSLQVQSIDIVAFNKI